MPSRRPRCQASSRSARRDATQASGSRRPTRVTRGVHLARDGSRRPFSRRVDPSARSTRSSPRGASTPAASSSRSRRSRRALSSLSSRHWQCRQTRRPRPSRQTRRRLWPRLWPRPPSSRPLLPGFGARLHPRALADAGEGPYHSRRASPPRANCAPGSRSTTCTCLYA